MIQQDWPGNILRSKGLCWIASRPNIAVNWSQAGASVMADKAGQWWCAFPENEWQLDAAARKMVHDRWHPVFADRYNEIVIIGQHLDKQKIITALDACLCNEVEISQWLHELPFHDPFPEL